ncbi:uncharacterized protein LOC124911429 [Impatiens glandulifera]|uniref:uncharacterized protein LOC124911429 n=1 Tax=Impatiens glandulifera TaxID=253017 RepID=UPI001FB105BF|nr:uncharacterized protein LOC124911429 [Impatiens glandulifera]
MGGGASGESVPAAVQSNPELNKICHQTDYPDICLSAIAPYMDDLGKRPDAASVLEFSVKAVSEQTQSAITTAEKVASGSGVSAEETSAINDCKDSYTDALENLKGVTDAISSSDVATMNGKLNSVITDFTDCDDFLKGFTLPLQALNARLTKIATNCLALVTLI